MPHQIPRILLYDLETSLQTVAVFGLGNNDWINPENIVTERYIICASWKWLGEAKVYSAATYDGNDKPVVEALHAALSEADAVVGHNSDSFDNKYLRTRILYHDLPPLPPITSIDTYKVAKSKFNFNSNKLDYIGRFLGCGQKIKTTPGLWLRVLRGEAKAVDEMLAYNKQDVILLEKVFLKLRPYMDNYINRELFGQKTGCPRCGSKKVQSRGVHRAITKVYQRWQCQTCSGWFKTVKAEASPAAKSRVI